MSEKDEIISQLVKCLDLDELSQGYRRRLLILDSQIEALRSIQNEMLGILGDMRQELDQFRRDRQICGRLNLLVDASVTSAKPDTKSKGHQKTNRNREHDKIKLNLVKPGQGIGT